MAAASDEKDNENEVVSTRIPKSIKREMQHEAVDRETSLSALVNELLLDAWDDYKQEHGAVVEANADE